MRSHDKIWAKLSKSRFVGATLGLLSAALAGGLFAPPAQADDGWKVTLTPYMWLQGSDGDLKVRGIKTQLSDSFLDMLEGTDTLIGGFAHLEAWRGDWGLYLEGNYSYTSTKSNVAFLKTQVKTALTILEGGGFYKLAGGAIEGAPGQSWQVEALAGIRYMAFNVKADAGPISLNRTLDWVDPLIGVSGHVDIAPSWTLIGHADVGGFGIGSDFTTNLYALVGYRSKLFGANVLSSFGYRGLYINRHDSSKNNSADLWLHGPVLGMTFRF